MFASLAVGCFVCLFGYSVESLGAPEWKLPLGFPWIFCFSGMS
jgi:hypothetical protein